MFDAVEEVAGDTKDAALDCLERLKESEKEHRKLKVVFKKRIAGKRKQCLSFKEVEVSKV